MDASEQITKFHTFIEQYYLPDLMEAVRKGNRFLAIDFSLISKFDPELADALLEQPEEVIKAAELSLEQFDLQGDVKGFCIRIANLSPSQMYMIRDIRSHLIGKLLAFEGVVRQKSDVRPQVTSSRFECPSCGNIMAVLQLDTKFKEPSRCGCGRKGKFRMVSKELVDAQSLVLEEATENLEGGEQPKRMNVFLKKDLVSPMSDKKTNPGTKILVNGTVKEVPIIMRSGAQSTRFDLLIEANYVESVGEDFGDVEISDDELKQIKKLAKDKDVYNKVVKSLAPSIYGHDRIKEALAYQMMGGYRKDQERGGTTRGDMHILLIGDPGSGKCLTGDTKIVLDNGEIRTIKSIVDNSEPAFTSSIDLHGSNTLSKIQRFWKRPSPEILLKITTKSGAEIFVTKNHPLFTTRNGLIYARQADDYSVGEHIALPSKINIEGELQTIQTNVKPSRARNKVKYSLNPIFDKNFARLLGYLVGDGYCRRRKTTGFISFTNKNQELLDDFEFLIKSTFGVNVSKRDKQNCSCYGITSIELLRILRNIDPNITKTSGEMSVSQMVCRSPNSIVSEYLKSLFECEGHIRNNVREIEFCSKSKELVTDIRLLLLRFGILSRIAPCIKAATNTKAKTARTYYRLFISGEDVFKYHTHIGFVSSTKQKKLSDLVNSKKIFNTNNNVIPNLGRILYLLRKKYGFSQNSFNIPRTSYQHYERGDRRPSAKQLKIICEKYNQLNDPLIDIINNASQSDVFWDQIKEIEQIDSKEEYVYDLEIQTVHNYIANGMVVHNSKLLKRMANVAPKARYVSGMGASGAGLTAAVVKDEFLSGWSLEAGAMVLANRGVCLIDELDKMNKEDRSALHEALEQQSYHFDTEIMFSDGTTQKIGEFVDYLMDKYKNKVFMGKDCQILKPSKLPSILTTDFKSIWPTHIDRVSRHKAPSFFYKISYSNGRSIVVTPEHPIFVEKAGDIITVDASKLHPNILAPAPRKIDIKPKYKHENDWDKNFALFLGLHGSEGHSYKNHNLSEIGICNTNDSVNKLIKDVMETTFKKKPSISTTPANRRKKATKDLTTIRICTRSAYRLMEAKAPEQLCKARTKRIPQYIKSSSRKLIENYLAGYFLGDGFVDHERIGFSTSSPSMAEDLQQILLSLGIYSYVEVENRKGTNYYKIVISGSDSIIQISTLVPNFDHRKKRVLKIAQRSKLKNNDRDIVPNSLLHELRDLLREFRLDDGYFIQHIKKGQNAHKKTCISKLKKLKNYLYKIPNCNDPKQLRKFWKIPVSLIAKKIQVTSSSIYNFEQKNHFRHQELLKSVISLKEEKKRKTEHILNKLSQIIERDIRFVKITKVEKIPNKNQKWTYDITIEPNHTFVSQNLILHNTITISKANIQATLRSETTVLAAANPKFGRFDPYGTIAEQIELPVSLINRFDLIFPIKDLPDEAKDRYLARFVLQMHQKDAEEPEIPTDLLRKYFSYGRTNIKPKLTDEAIEELENYYLKMRASGSSEGGVKSIPISARQLEGMIRLSEASAKIRLSKKVTKEDAKRAVSITDYCLRQIALDEETGTIDIDRIATSVTATQRSKIMGVKEVISDLENKLGKTIPIDDVIKEAVDKGISESDAEETIERLKRSGDIFEPKRGFISRI